MRLHDARQVSPQQTQKGEPSFVGNHPTLLSSLDDLLQTTNPYFTTAVTVSKAALRASATGGCTTVVSAYRISPRRRIRPPRVDGIVSICFTTLLLAFCMV